MATMKRASKSLPLHGGIVEEVDDFLLEPAGMQMSKNTRFTKKDLAEKARSYTDPTTTGAGNYSPKIAGAWSRNNTVAVMGRNNVALSNDMGATWTQEEQEGDLFGIERILGTAEFAGATNLSWAPVGGVTANSWDVVGYMVAYESVQPLGVASQNNRTLEVRVYNLDGVLTAETSEEDAFGPRCLPGDGNAFLWYQTSTGRIKSLFTTTGLLLTTGDDEAKGAQTYCQYYNNTDTSMGSTPHSPGDMRLGYSRDLFQNVGSVVATMPLEDGNRFGAVAWKDEAAGTIEVQRTDSGLFLDTASTILTDSYAGTESRHKVLDIASNDTYVYVLYSSYDPATDLTTVELWQGEWTTNDPAPVTPGTTTISSADTRLVVNGSVELDSTGRVHMAWTNAYGDPTENMHATQGRHSVQWAIWTSGAIGSASEVDSSTIYSRRICSNVVVDRDNNPYICLQQWDNWNPDMEAGGGSTNPKVRGLIPTHLKPVTSHLVRLTDGSSNDHQVISTFDAGQGKSVLPGEDEQNTALGGSLWYYSDGTQLYTDQRHEFYYGNRVLLTPSDDYYYLTNVAAPLFATGDFDARSTMTVGTARFAMYRVSSTIDIPTTDFPDGLFMGSAVPAWYDGAFDVVNASPIDSPEVVGISTNSTGADGVNYIAYQDLAISGDEATAVQVVVGFFDEAGRAHRSAPSSLIYAGNTTAETSQFRDMTVYVTPPLGLSNRDYYIEVYHAQPGEDPQLAAVKSVSTRGDDRIPVTFAANFDPEGSGTGSDFDIARSSKFVYTAGNVLAADPWPNFDIVINSGRRLFAHSISDPNTVYYSKTFEQNVAPEFSAALTISLANETITAMGAIDDKVIAFTRENAWVIYGTGPDNTGANGDFFVERLNFSLGCASQQSVLSYDDGVAFYSNTTNEFHLITRDLQLVDIGENVQTLSGNIVEVENGIVVAGEDELRWYCQFSDSDEYVPSASPPANTPDQPPRPFLASQVGETYGMLVFNYKYAKWSLRTFNNTMTDTRPVKNGVFLINDNTVGVVYPVLADFFFRKETESNWPDSELVTLETPWIKVNQLQDFGRIWAVTLLGKYLSSWDDLSDANEVEAGDIEVEVLYDYEGAGATSDTYRFRANQDFNVGAERLQLMFKPSRQKCQALKLKITERATQAIELHEPTYTRGQGFVLSAVDLEYGLKRVSGGRKLLGESRKK